jgi:hypothetical protein
MATLEELEGLLAEALQCLSDAAGVVRGLPELEARTHLKRLGDAINNAWEIRDQIFRIRPDLKPPFVVEHEENRTRYDGLAEIAEEAHDLEESGKTSQARQKFLELHRSSVRGYFRMVAEAGLFRLSQSPAQE